MIIAIVVHLRSNCLSPGQLAIVVHEVSCLQPWWWTYYARLYGVFRRSAHRSSRCCCVYSALIRPGSIAEWRPGCCRSCLIQWPIICLHLGQQQQLLLQLLLLLLLLSLMLQLHQLLLLQNKVAAFPLRLRLFPFVAQVAKVCRGMSISDCELWSSRPTLTIQTRQFHAHAQRWLIRRNVEKGKVTQRVARYGCLGVHQWIPGRGHGLWRIALATANRT